MMMRDYVNKLLTLMQLLEHLSNEDIDNLRRSALPALYDSEALKQIDIRIAIIKRSRRKVG